MSVFESVLDMIGKKYSASTMETKNALAQYLMSTSEELQKLESSNADVSKEDVSKVITAEVDKFTYNFGSQTPVYEDGSISFYNNNGEKITSLPKKEWVAKVVEPAKAEEKKADDKSAETFDASAELKKMVEEYCASFADRGIQYTPQQKESIVIFVNKFMALLHSDALDKGQDLSNLNPKRAMARILNSMKRCTPKFDDKGAISFDYSADFFDKQKPLFERAKDAFNAEKQVAPANKTQDENQGPSLEGAEIPEEEKEAKTKKMSEILHQEPESLSDKFKGYNVKFAQKFLKKMYENLLKTEVAEKEKPEVIGSNGEQVVEETYPKTVKRVPPNNTFQEVDPKDPSTWQPAPLYCIEKEGADPREVTLPELINMHNGLDQLNLGGQAGMLGMMGMFNPMLWPMMNPLVATYMSKMVPIFPVTQPPINVPQAGTPQFTEQEIREMYAFTVVGAGVNAKMCEVLEPKRDENGNVIPETEEAKNLKGALASDIQSVFTLLSNPSDIPIKNTSIKSADESKTVVTTSFKSIIRDAVMQFSLKGAADPDFKKSLNVIQKLCERGEEVFPDDMPPETKKKMVEQMQALSRGLDALSQVFEPSDLMMMFGQSSRTASNNTIIELGGKLNEQTMRTCRYCNDPYTMMTMILTASYENCIDAKKVAQNNMTQVPENLAIYAELYEEQRKAMESKAQQEAKQKDDGGMGM